MNTVLDSILSIALGAVMGCFVAMAVTETTYKEGLKECQAELPRSQKCEKVWVNPTQLQELKAK